MMKKRDFAAFVILAALAACAGGGGGGTAIAPSSTQTAPTSNASAGVAPASFTITIPKTSTASIRRSPAFIPANTQAITMTLLQSNGTNISAAAQTVQGPFALVNGAPGCTSGATALTCTFTINAPLGGDIFVAQTYSTTTAAAGTLIGSGAVALTVADNVRNAASISLNGPVVSVKLFADTSNFYTQTTSMAPRSARIFVIALDAQNNVIINPSTYDTPIFLSLDLSQFIVIGGVTLSGTYAYGQAPMSITGQTGSLPVYSPSDLITFTINAPPPNLIGQVKIVASVGGSSQNPPLVLGIASPTPSPSPPAPPITPPPTPAPTPSPTMTPSPTPTPTPPGIGYVDTDGSPGFTDGGYATSTNTTTSTFELGAPAPAPGSNSISVMERIAYSGTVTLSSAGCAGNVMVAAGAADFTNTPKTVTYSGPIVLTLTPTSTSASSSCVVNATDGTQTALLNVDVNSLNLTVSARRKK